MARCKARHTANSALPHPSTWKWYLDSEPFLLWTGNRNGVKIPEYLASQAGTTGSIWNTYPVPGSSGWAPPTSYPLGINETRHGQTLAEMWAQAVTAYGFPTNPAAAFDSSLRADDPENRAYMLWWGWVVQRSIDATFANCYYGVLATELGSGVACGNYNTADYDGVVDQTPWYTSPSATRPSGSAFVSNAMPRCWIDPQPAMHGPLLTQHNAASGTYGLWHSVAQHASGSRSSPELYSMNCTQLDGLVRLDPEDPPCSSSIGLAGHRQPDLYKPGAPDETDLRATLRVHRHAVESIINSNGGGREVELTLWVAQYTADELVTDPIPYYTDEAPQRAFFAFGRGVNIPEYIQWTGTGSNAAQSSAWRHTVDLMTRVYAYTVTDLKPLGGMVPSSSPDLEPSMLEFTLRDRVTDAPYTADTVPGAWNVIGTMLRVEVSGLETPISAPDFQCGPNSCWAMRHEINLEGTVKNATTATVGSVDLWRVPINAEDPGQWEEFSSMTFGITTPDGAFRETFELPNLGAYIDENGKLLIRLRVIGGLSTIVV